MEYKVSLSKILIQIILKNKYGKTEIIAFRRFSCVRNASVKYSFFTCIVFLFPNDALAIF